MTVDSQQDVEALKEIGRIVALTIKEMKQQACVGMTTKALDEIGGRVLKQYGAVSAPKQIYNFPGNTCISINHEIAHGVPSDRKIKAGDLINIDVSAEKDGYYADAGHSFQIPPFDEQITRLCQDTYRTMMKVIQSLKHGVRINEVGKIIQAEAAKGGYQIIENLCSHGIGRSLHEEPLEIFPTYDKSDKRVLTEGLVITIEPFLSTGARYAFEREDGWTLCLPNNSYAAQHEHTIVITRDKPIILTVA